jgi:hypothetical protein
MKSLLILLILIVLSNAQSETNTQKINYLLDSWHQAAATADEHTFFGRMSEDAIYLGTDKAERWLRDDLKKWSEKYFSRDKAWAFTSFNRHINYSSDKKVAWFDELLNTQMGICRGSGVLEYIKNDWKIKHYDLSIMIDNNLVDTVKKLSEKSKKDN